VTIFDYEPAIASGDILSVFYYKKVEISVILKRSIFLMSKSKKKHIKPKKSTIFLTEGKPYLSFFI
jgi:hypothetical protein